MKIIVDKKNNYCASVYIKGVHIGTHILKKTKEVKALIKENQNIQNIIVINNTKKRVIK